MPLKLPAPLVTRSPLSQVGMEPTTRAGTGSNCARRVGAPGAAHHAMSPVQQSAVSCGASWGPQGVCCGLRLRRRAVVGRGRS